MRRIKKARIKFISLVPRGANRMPVVYKSDGTVEFETLFKAADDQGELLAVVYAPESRDTQGDIASAEVIKEMAHDALRAGGPEVDIRHDGKAVGRERAFVAESFLVAKGDERFAGWKDHDGNDAGDLTGAWATVIKLEDPELRALVKSGEIGAVSMAGSAEVEQEKADDDFLRRFKHFMAGLIGRDTKDDIEMKADELTKILTDNNEALAKSIVEGITAALKPAEETPAPVEKGEKPAPAPEAEFKGDPTDLKAVKAHAEALAKAALAKGVDWNDAASVQAYADKLAALEKADPADDSDGEDEDGEQVRKAERPRSAQPGPGKDDPRYAGLSKAEREELEESDAMVAEVQRLYGRKPAGAAK